MLHKNVVRPTSRKIEWCIEHDAPKRPEYPNQCWEMSVQVMMNDCQFLPAEVLIFSEQPPA